MVGCDGVIKWNGEDDSIWIQEVVSCLSIYSTLQLVVVVTCCLPPLDRQLTLAIRHSNGKTRHLVQPPRYQSQPTFLALPPGYPFDALQLTERVASRTDHPTDPPPRCLQALELGHVPIESGPDLHFFISSPSRRDLSYHCPRGG